MIQRGPLNPSNSSNLRYSTRARVTRCWTLTRFARGLAGVWSRFCLVLRSRFLSVLMTPFREPPQDPPPRTAVHVSRDPFQIKETGRKGFSSACKAEICDVIGDGDLSDAYRGSPLSLLSAARASAT